MLFIWAVIWWWDYRMSSWSLWAGLWRNLKSRKVEVRQWSGTGEKKILFIISNRSYANPEYLFVCQMGLAVCKQENEELLSSMVDSKPPKAGVSQELTLMRIPWEQSFLLTQSVREKSEHYGSWSEWDIRYSEGGNGGDTSTQQNFDCYKTPKGNRGGKKKKKAVQKGLRPFWPKWKKVSEKSEDKHKPSKFFSLLLDLYNRLITDGFLQCVGIGFIWNLWVFRLTVRAQLPRAFYIYLFFIFYFFFPELNGCMKGT